MVGDEEKPSGENQDHAADTGDPFALGSGDADEPHAIRPDVLTVTELTRRIRRLLEQEIGSVVVEGEISNWRVAASGHAYFVLKDADASIRCVMFRSAATRLRFAPADGRKVEVRGRVSVYEARGEYQIIVEGMAEQGLGALFEAFLRLKERLEKEGLFDPERKKPLPFLPRRIGVITSPTGAAIRDILNVLGRRFANLHVLLWPVRVQGEGAAREIAHALREMDKRQLADVIICGRGGGSLEDLWAFNEEIVARALYASRTPVISAVGHETDFTIADFVADLRAPTPSAAAELVVRNQAELRERLQSLDRRVEQAAVSRVRYQRSRLDGLMQSYTLEEPRFRLQQLQQQLDDWTARIATRTHDSVQRGRERLDALYERLGLAAGGAARAAVTHLAEHRRRLDRAAGEQAARTKLRLDALLESLDILGPQATLERGYSMVIRRRTGEIVRAPGQVSVNDPLNIHTAGGLLPALATPPLRARQDDLLDGPDCGAR